MNSMPLWSSILSFLASLVGPTIAAFALRHAVKRADAHLLEWRQQKLLERNADLAIRALALIYHYRSLISQASQGQHSGSKQSIDEHWGIVDAKTNEFNETIYLVRAQLGTSEAGAMDAIWYQRATILTQLQHFPVALSPEEPNVMLVDKHLEQLNVLVGKAQEAFQAHISMTIPKTGGVII